MAAVVSAWAKPGGWALDSEENEAELLQQHNQDVATNKGADTADFPSLSTATSTKAKKKKPQTLSLQEFSTYGAAKPAQSEAPKGLTPDELLLLPTGPRQRSSEELERNKLGGGFRSYGGYRDEQPRRQGSFNRDQTREYEPSRADESDSWAAGKKSSLNNGFERKERGGFFTDSLSRADDSDNWVANKSFIPSETRRHDKRGSFGSDSSNWGEGRKAAGGAFDSLRERRGVSESNGVDSETWGRKREDESFGSGGRPRLNLKPRTLPKDDGQKGSEIKIDAKPKGNNPFGEARPREEVLKELGQDVKAIEEKLESTKIKGVAADDDRKMGFWNGKGRQTAWRKPESVDYRLERLCRDEESANGAAEKSEKGDAEKSENGAAEKSEKGDAEKSENGAAEGEDARIF